MMLFDTPVKQDDDGVEWCYSFLICFSQLVEQKKIHQRIRISSFSFSLSHREAKERNVCIHTSNQDVYVSMNFFFFFTWSAGNTWISNKFFSSYLLISLIGYLEMLDVEEKKEKFSFVMYSHDHWSLFHLLKSICSSLSIRFDWQFSFV